MERGRAAQGDKVKVIAKNESIWLEKGLPRQFQDEMKSDTQKGRRLFDTLTRTHNKLSKS